MDSATRVTRARTPLSRAGVPTPPWRYLLATMLVAVMDQVEGTSTSFCSKMSLPFQSWMTASRFSQVSSSKGETPGRVKWRVKRKPGVLPCCWEGAEEVEAAAGAAWVSVSAMAERPFVDRVRCPAVVPVGAAESWIEDAVFWGAEDVVFRRKSRGIRGMRLARPAPL